MLQFITHENQSYTTLSGAQAALEGGCRWIQLRMKTASRDQLIETGKALRLLCNRYDATFIIDDHADLVHELQADGVHLGKKDMPPTEARRLLGETAIIGGTANTFEDICRLAEAGVNYIGLGPFRFTTTKSNLSPVLGLSGYQRIIEQCRQHDIHLPIVAIGGIVHEDVSALMQTGITGIALSGAILNAADPVQEMRTLIEKIGI